MTAFPLSQGSPPSREGPSHGEGILAHAPARQRRRSRANVVAPPLGSLTQREHQSASRCRGCGSMHITRLSLCLTDGTPVEFTSCHHCEHRTWEHAGAELTVESVLHRTTSP